VNVVLGNKLYQTFDFIFQDMNYPILIVDTNNNCKKFNHSMQKLIGDCESFNFTDFLDKMSLEIWHEFSKASIANKHASCDVILQFPKQQTSTSTHIKGQYDSDLKETVLYLNFPIKESNCNLSVLTKEYEEFFNFTKQGIIVSSACGDVLDATGQVEKFFSVKKEDVIGQRTLCLLDMFMDSQKEIQSFLKRLNDHGKAEVICSWKTDKEEEKYFQFMTMYNTIDETYVTLISDTTDKVQLKKQLEHYSDLSVLGQMAASIAHEIRNPMTSLKGFTQLLNYSVTETGKEYLKVIHNELDRMDSILNEFLLLSKPKERSIQFISTTDLLSQVIEFMYPQAIMQNCILQLEKCDLESDCILGDEKELKKVFMNIIKNGIEEMEEGGTITISQTLFEESKVKISIQDTGKGMTKDQINKIFLPFFTTKTKGTGLGLAHVLRTVEDHDGYIDVESEFGSGTTFHLILPLYGAESLKEQYIKDQLFVKSNT